MNASMQVTSAAEGWPAFFRTNNSGYGVKWEAAGDVTTNKDDPNEVPQYRELVSHSQFGRSTDGNLRAERKMKLLFLVASSRSVS